MTIILIDMDGVVADYDTNLINKMKIKHPEIDIHKDNIWNLINENNHFYDSKKEISYSSDFYLEHPIINGAKDAIMEMLDNGYQIFFCSSPTVKNMTCHSDKNLWIRHYFGNDLAKKLILTKDKTVVHGDYLIDDKFYINGVNKNPSWTHILFDQPYNRHTEHKHRLKNWSDWKYFINDDI